MKVLWLSPWMRPLARIHCDLLREAGHDVRLVTTDQHPEIGSGAAHAVDGEWVVDARYKRPWTWPVFWRLRRRVRRFRPDVVVTELVRDPRWILLDRTAPRVDVVHDDRPHGADEELPGWERRAFGRWRSGARLTLVHSRYVGDRIGVESQALVPLTSDLPETEVPHLVPAADRRDFVMAGRLNGYKNIPLVLRAWTLHHDGALYRGDVLMLIGEADTDLDLPPGVRWERGPFRYADQVQTLARAKGSLAHYRVATQSGVQVLAMQLGVMPIVSDQGGLPEYQPPGGPVVGVDDVVGLAAAFDRLADPDIAAAQGLIARRTFDQRHSPAAVSAALVSALATLPRARPSTR